MKKRLVVILAASLITMAATVSAAVREGEFSLTPVIGGYTFEGKQHVETNPVYGIRAGYTLTKNLGVEGLFDYVASRSTQGAGDVNLYRYGGEVLYHFIPDNRLVPYVAAGFAGLSREIAGSMQKSVGAFDYGLGVKYALFDNFALRGDVRHLIYSYGGSTYNNVEYTIGLHFPFGGMKPVAKAVEPSPVQESPKAAAPPPVAVEPPPKPASTLSAMPSSITSGHAARLIWTSQNTGECVIQPGIGPVPLQGERDVTPSADTTYTLTCTGAGGATTSTAAITVAAPPPPAPVVEQTAQKAAAAQRFCNKPAILEIAFDTNKTDIKPKYYGELKTLGDFLVEFPNARGEIAGHTDNVGGKAFNLKLSQRRAESVKNYLVETFGIAAERIGTKGYGFSKPIASNKTKAGKAKNRRIEANFTCGD